MIELMFLEEFKLIRQFDTCHYWYFLDKNFKGFMSVMGAKGVLMMSMNLSNIAVLNIDGVDYRCNISGVSKSETVNLR